MCSCGAVPHLPAAVARIFWANYFGCARPVRLGWQLLLDHAQYLAIHLENIVEREARCAFMSIYDSAEEQFRAPVFAQSGAVVTVLPIRFGDCDLAGIAYYPRLLALVDAAVEDWTLAIIGVDRATMHHRDHCGLPTLKLSTSFDRPCRLGEQLALSVRAVAVSARSVTLDLSGRVGGELRFSAELVQVLIDTKSTRSRLWPDIWRERIAATIA